MENNMFCFQCQETAKGFGCTLKGVCGKNATTARTMDLLLFVVRGISVVADQLRQHSLPVEKEVDNFIVDALFCTITNANFDDESITKRIDKGLAIRDDLKHQASAKDIPLHIGMSLERSVPEPRPEQIPEHLVHHQNEPEKTPVILLH